MKENNNSESPIRIYEFKETIVFTKYIIKDYPEDPIKEISKEISRQLYLQSLGLQLNEY